MNEIQPGFIHDLSDEDYHADPIPEGSLSSTMVRLLTDFSPAKALARRDRKPTAAMNLGKAAHAHALGTGPQLIVWQHDGRTKAGKEERAEHAELLATEAAVAVTADQRDQIIGMSQALMSIPEVGAIIDYSEAEVSAVWREGSVWGRARIDLLGDDRSHDYKTTHDASARGFVKAMAGYGYHQQAEWYQRALKALGHEAGDRPMRFICQETEPPFIVQIHEPDEEALEVAKELNDRAIGIYAACVESGIWPGPARIVNEPTALPNYYYYDREDVLGPVMSTELKLA